MALPTALQPAIKRAKKSIQNSLLHPGDLKKKKIALDEIENANNISSQNGRIKWQTEMLIIPHYNLCPGDWYLSTNEIQWSIDKMPKWVENGKNEPDVNYSINGISYTSAPNSVKR